MNLQTNKWKLLFIVTVVGFSVWVKNPWLLIGVLPVLQEWIMQTIYQEEVDRCNSLTCKRGVIGKWDEAIWVSVIVIVSSSVMIAGWGYMLFIIGKVVYA